jgi:tetratricopeptide (TPR) repeat protein
MKKILAILAAAVFIGCSCPAQESGKTSIANYHSDSVLFQALSSNVVAALNSTPNPAVDAALDKMLAESKDKVASSFAVAKMEWLLNRPTKAISILEEVINKHGAETNMQWWIKNTIVANLWIGSISRQYGDIQRATKAYSDILECVRTDEGLSGLAVYCYLYQAEIQGGISSNQDNAIKTLNAIKEIKSPIGQDRVEAWQIYQEWADFEEVIISKGANVARLTLKGDHRKTGACIMLAMTQLECNGVIAEPITGFYNDERQKLLEVSLDMAIECRRSPIDRSLAQFELARVFERKKEAARAEKYYGDLLASDSFFAPEGGVFLADFQKRQGSADEAKKTYEKIKQRFPGYAKYVDELAKDPAPVNFSM